MLPKSVEENGKRQVEKMNDAIAQRLSESTETSGSIFKTAHFSACRTYRYALWRCWERQKPYALFIGLNPSTADEKEDDPTIRRCVGFAKAWGYGALCMVNLFALRATKPKDMLVHPSPIGPDNDKWLEALSRQAGVTVAAWGVNGNHLGRDSAVREFIGGLKCLKKTKDGYPGHPLYLPRETELRPF